MSDRGSFVTEYIYCKKCFESAKSVFINKHLISIPIGNEPIIAGRITGLYPGEEIEIFRNEFIPKLQKVICCRLRVSVLAEEGEEVFIAVPSQKAIEKSIKEIK